jgi:hypothetical protein
MRKREWFLPTSNKEEKGRKENKEKERRPLGDRA